MKKRGKKRDKCKMTKKKGKGINIERVIEICACKRERDDYFYIYRERKT